MGGISKKYRKIKRVAFVYVYQEAGEYCLSDDLSYSIQRRPKLGLQYLCAVLKEKAIETTIIDQTVSLFDLEGLIKELKEYDLAGFYSSDVQEDQIKNFCKKIKSELDIPILVGGPSTFTNSTFLDYGCDIVVHGEGEITIQQIIEYYNGEKGLGDIKGISYKENGKIIRTPPQELIKDLDEVPFPDRSSVDINSYYDYFVFSMKKPYITIMASRGCFNRCTFCMSCRIWEYKYRRRSVDNVLAEIDAAVKKYKIRYVAFQDDIFGATNEWIEEFCEKLIKRPYRIRWMPIFYPFTLRKDTERILRLIKKSGCDTLSFGLQSAHPEILKNINRDPAEPQQLKKILKVANRLGFVTVVSYIFGLPGDTRETIQETIEYSVSCGSTLAQHFMLSVLRGSEIERVYKNKKICELSAEDIQRLTIYASKRFYKNPRIALKIGYCVIKNPGWLIKVGFNVPSILTRLGFLKVAAQSCQSC